jgi:isoquinoline 1-oxidoreductase
MTFEPERYELSEPARYRFELPRRDFLRVLTAMGSGLLIVAALPEAPGAQQGESGRGGQGRASGDLASWLHIDADGRVTAFTGKVEIGQNVRTSLAQTIGDELRVPLTAITMVMADTDLTPFDQGTFGSQTTPRMAPVLARAAATAREMLIDEAASRWSVDRAVLVARDGKVMEAVPAGAGAPVLHDGRSITYGELMKGKALQGVVPANAAEKETPRDRWTLRGTPARKVDGRAFVTGRHAFTPDIVRPNMQFGRVVRPPAYGGTPRVVDDSKARAMAGVTVVRDGNFIGVVAPSDRAAARAAAAIDIHWDLPTGLPSSETVYEHFKQTASAARAGAAAGETRPAGRAFDASYQIPYIAHVPLEPRAAVAEWTGAKLTVWTGTQRPFGVRTEVAQAFHQPEEQVRVIVPDMGSGYGGKHTGEQAVEAARLAKAAGRAVKLVYTRAEEFMWGYFRPGGVIDIAATVDASGRLVWWAFDNYNSGNSGLNTPYVVVGGKREAFRQTDSPLRQGSYRGLAATANHYAREMHMDAMARALGVDAVDFRMQHLEDTRMRAVLTTAAQKAGWPRPSQPGRALGIACGTEKGGYIATVAEVSKVASPAAGASPFKVERLVVVFECGAIVNPDGLKHQVEGAVVQGLGGALFERIEFADGKLHNGTMADYRVPRFKDVPPIDVILLDRRDLPSAGAGETPIVCVAPAIGSAVRAFGTVATKLPVTLVL